MDAGSIENLTGWIGYCVILSSRCRAMILWRLLLPSSFPPWNWGYGHREVVKVLLSVLNGPGPL